MKSYQKQFIALAIAHKNLLFGEFVLKSGRVSPYFFNAGLFDTGHALRVLGECYAHAIIDSGVAFDMLFGPAYKAIPFVAAAAMALSEHYDRDVPYCYNRKEIKPYAEGGSFVGAPLRGRVLILDDIISAGVTAKESIRLIEKAGAEAVGLVIAFDRQERGEGPLSAMEELHREYGITVSSVARLEHIIEYLQAQPEMQETLKKMKAYYTQYGVKA